MAKSSIREGLWRAILEDREDDLPRLAFADWCEENGDDARARFIRLQIEQAKVEEDDPRHWRLETHIRPLWLANEWAWRAEVPEWCRKSIVFRRGFAYAAEGTIGAVGRSGRALLRKHPIGSLKVREGKPDELMAVLAWPEMARLRELAFRDCMVDGRAAGMLGRSVNFTGMRSLAFLAMPSLTAAPEALAGEALAGLTSLRWECYSGGGDRWTSLSEAEMAAIGEGPWRGLRTLCLDKLFLGPPEAAILAAAPALCYLRRLELDSMPLEDGGVAALTRADWPALRHLSLSGCRLTGEGIGSILAWRQLPELRWLDVGFTTREARQLASAPATRSLAHLDVRGNDIGDAGLAAFATSPTLPELRSLKIGINGLSPDGLRPLLMANALSRLERLNVSLPVRGDEAAQALIDSRHLPSLAWLTLPIMNVSERTKAALLRRFPFVGHW